MKPMLRLLPLLAAIVLSAGCNTMLPAHPDSCDRTNEQVSVRLMSVEDLDDDTHADYDAVNTGLKAQSLSLAALTPVAISLASRGIDYVKNALKEEARSYEASYSATVGVPAFYKIDASTSPASYEKRYDVIEVKRTTSRGDAFEFRAAMFYSMKKQGFYLVPIQFRLNSAKAKVLNTSSSWNFLTRIPFLYGWLLKSETRVDVAVSLAFEGFAVRTENVKETYTQDGKVSVVEYTRAMPLRPALGTAEFKVSGYDLSTKEFLRYSNKSIAQAFSGWILTPPVSQPGGDGALAVTVTVYEKDTSNAASYVNRLNENIDKDRIIAEIKNMLADQTTK